MTAEPGARPAAVGAGPIPSTGDTWLELSDVELVRLVATGHGRALEALYQRFARPAHGLARRIITDPQLAQDVVQECFLSIWRNPAGFDPARGAFSSWLLAMVHHKSVDSVRREENLRKRRSGLEVLADAESERRTDEDAVDLVKGERVRSALHGLPDAQREALVLAYFGGYTQREIAGLTGAPLGTVKTRMSLGMKALRGRLDGWSERPATGQA